MDSAVSSMSGFFSWGNPSADDQTPEAARFRNDYQSLYDINYRTTGGNADAAKKMTNQQIARTWSISEVNGSAKLMKYARKHFITTDRLAGRQRSGKKKKRA